MAKMVELNWNPDRDALRSFGWIALGGFSFIALLAWNEWLVFAYGLGGARPYFSAAFVALGLLSALFSLFAPGWNRPIYLGLALISFPIGFVLSYVIIGTLFFGLITPAGIIMKLIGRDAMRRSFEAEAPTYWTNARPERSNESYFRQF